MISSMHCYCYKKNLHKILSEWINAMVFGVKAAAGTDQKPGPPSVDQILEDLQVGLFINYFLDYFLSRRAHYQTCRQERDC